MVLEVDGILPRWCSILPMVLCIKFWSGFRPWIAQSGQRIIIVVRRTLERLSFSQIVAVPG